MNKEELIKKLEDIEWEDFEVKEAKSEIPKNSWETVSAFSNTAGGWIIFGVKKAGKKYYVLGVTNPEKIAEDFTTVLRNGNKFNKRIDVTSKKYDFDSKTVLAFYIPKKSSRDKPVYFNSIKNTFIRTASGDQRATQEEIDTFFRTASFEEKDKELTKYTINDLDEETIIKYRSYFAQMNPGHRYNALGNTEFLQKLSVINDDRVTYGGLLVFGNEDSLIREIPHYKIEYLEIAGISYEDAPTRYSVRLTSETNLFTAFFDIYERLSKKVDVPFSIKAGFRDDDPPHLQAIREALVNLVMHTDYFSPANPRIRVFSNRFEFFNPGALPKDIEFILKEDFSLPRNPIIAKIFRFVKLAENIGSGFHKMINGWDSHYRLKPLIDGDFDFYKITFPTTQKTTLDDTIKDIIKDTITSLPDNERKIFEEMQKNPSITAQELSKMLSINLRNTKKNIEKIKEKGLIKRVGSRKSGYWEVVRK